MKTIKSFLFLISILSTFTLFSQDYDESFQGIYIRGNQSFYNTDAFNISGGMGVEVGFSWSSFLHPKGDFVGTLSYSYFTSKIEGITLENGVSEKVTNSFYSEELAIGAYYYHYIVMNDETGFFVSAQAGFRYGFDSGFTIRNNQEDEGDYYGVFKTNDLQNLEIGNMYYGIGAGVGNNKIRVILMYHASLTDMFRNERIYENGDSSYPNEGEPLNKPLKPANLSLGITYTFRLF